MSTTREKLAAITTMANASGRTREQVLRALAPTYDRADVIQLHSAIARTPAPPTAQERAATQQARVATANAVAQNRVNQDAAAIGAWRTYSAIKARNPVLAAAQMNSNAAEINRGRELDSLPDDSGPDAA